MLTLTVQGEPFQTVVSGKWSCRQYLSDNFKYQICPVLCNICLISSIAQTVQGVITVIITMGIYLIKSMGQKI